MNNNVVPPTSRDESITAAGWHEQKIAQLKRDLADGKPAIPAFKSLLQDSRDELAAQFARGIPAYELVLMRAQIVDQVLINAWQVNGGAGTNDMALVAVGGYGRGELHPASDIDILILATKKAIKVHKGAIEKFLMFLWDIGLQVGHSVRTLKDCVTESKNDITVMTNLIESRLVDGPESMFDELKAKTNNHKIWPSKKFFEAKWQEQTERHARFHDTAYNLEPNIKEGPGGLRDIQMIGWVAKHHFGGETLHDLVHHGFLDEPELAALIAGQNFLWDVRFALHVLTKRREDRLLFDYQTTLAKQFGYEDHEHSLAVEQFMQRYYRTIMELSRLNEILLQHFQEAILLAGKKESIVSLNTRFQIRNGFIEAKRNDVFEKFPFALLEVFLLALQERSVKGIRASTIRLIRAACDQVDDSFRQDIRCRTLFMEILRQASGITREFRRMHRYGVLAAYLPAFEKIVGRMQYDLFHVYTVDSHSLMVLRNLRRYSVPKFVHEYPFCSSLVAQIPKRELIYIAALFHDIAKGRKGDHSELGAVDAYEFCIQHGLSQYDARFVSWLVRHHLLMSMTAQRKDISDPYVVMEFARKVGDIQHLNYLYLLTVSDIRATNPELYNSWRAALLLELYQSTKRAIRRGLWNPLDESELVDETKNSAKALLVSKKIHHMRLKSFWRNMPDEYFVRYSPEEISWHTPDLVANESLGEPIIQIRKNSPRGGSEIFVYVKDANNIFALIAQTLDQLGLDVLDARIITSTHGYTCDSYLVLERDGNAVTDDGRLETIRSRLLKALREQPEFKQGTKSSLTRHQKHFSIPTQISFEQDKKNGRTAIEVVAADRPGLLATIGRVFLEQNISIKNAKIATIGERAEDIFYVTDQHDKPIKDPDHLEAIKQQLCAATQPATKEAS